MPHRPLFVSRCHHFSPVIYFIAISVSLPSSLHRLSFFTCALPPLPPAARSLFLSLSCAPCLRTPSKLSTTQRNTIPLSSPSRRLYYTFLSLSHSHSFPFSVGLELSAFSFLFRSRCLAPEAFRRRYRVREGRREAAEERGRNAR